MKHVVLMIFVTAGLQCVCGQTQDELDALIGKLRSELLVVIDGFSAKINKMITQNVAEQLKDSRIKVEALQEKNRRLDAQLSASNNKIEALEARIHQLAPPPVKPPTIVKEDKAIAGSCEELRIVDSASESGVYRIDPDGTDNGDDPITVYCNMTTGSTIISHDSEGLVLVPDCIGDGCFKKTIVYQATMRQMIALLRQSQECIQSFEFRYSCLDNRFGLVESSWWQDRHNISRPFTTCVRQTDETDPAICTVSWCPDHQRTDILPVTRLHLGRQPDPLMTLWPSLHGYEDLTGTNRFRLGKLECTGFIPGLKSLFTTTTTEAPPTTTPSPDGVKCEVRPPEAPEQKKEEPSSRVCPKDIGKFTNCNQTEISCYCMVQVLQNWTQSVDYCKNYAMELVAIETRHEQQVLRKLLSQWEGYYWWTSGSDERSEDRWFWSSTGKPFNYTNWYEYWPKGGVEKNFMQIRSWAGYKWYASHVNDRDFAICEY